MKQGKIAASVIPSLLKVFKSFLPSRDKFYKGPLLA